ncbi:SPL family radical SAM protein [Alkalihalobacterium bogoriense]|uniref:SPL family radical SAM protein n=1 Tax=Alkalihalobacterium bogoriense TaxID=246272 RepID=UPI000554E72D|nr:radical SAM protein [Alkalihalobacterium bogoriense]
MKRELEVNYTTPSRILTATGGFLSGYSHSLNPYTGCSFACSYCYVRKSPVGLFRRQEWGTWVDIKQSSQEKLKREIANVKKKGKEVTIFMSSSTDPYQPIDYKEKRTRHILEALVEAPPDFLFIQTRSSLVTRDIDVITKLGDKVRVSMTVETDCDSIRKRFSPYAPPIQARLKAIWKLRESNIPVQVAVSPVLPFTNQFPKMLSKLVDRIVIDDYFSGDGSHGKRTEKLNIKELYDEGERKLWYGKQTHQHAFQLFQDSFNREQILFSQEGFLPG